MTPEELARKESERLVQDRELDYITERAHWGAVNKSPNTGKGESEDVSGD